MFFKGATKLYFTHYLCGYLLSTGLYKSAFSIYYFAKLVFRLSVLWFFVFLWFLVFCLIFSTQCHLIRLKVVLSPSKQRSLFLQWKPFKNDEKCFLFHFKSSFPVEKAALKDDVNLKIYYVTTWLTKNYNAQLPNISRSKGNQTLKFSQVKEYN